MMETLLLDLINGSDANARNILSGLNGAPIAESGRVAGMIPIQMANTLSRILGAEPLGASYYSPPSSGSEDYS
jgi:hypothetical protein